MATVKEINHDSSTTLTVHYDTVSDTDGKLSVGSAGALNSSTYGVICDFSTGTANASLEEAFTYSDTDLRWRIRIKMSSLTNNSADNTAILNLDIRKASTGDQLFLFAMASAGSGAYKAQGLVIEEGGSQRAIAAFGTISATAEVCLEIRAIRETTVSANDGIAEFYIDGSSQGSLTDVNNFTRWNNGIDTTSIVFTDNANLSGDLYYDEWILDDDNTGALCPATSFSGYDLIRSSGGQL